MSWLIFSGFTVAGVDGTLPTSRIGLEVGLWGVGMAEAASVRCVTGEVGAFVNGA